MDIWTSFAISAASGVFAAIASVWLSLRQFQQQRWWERKLDAYTAVVEALHDMSTSLDSDLMATGAGATPIAPDRKAALDAKYSEASAKLSRLIDMGELLLSRRAIRELRQMYREIDAADRKGDVPMYSDYLAHALEAVLGCQAKFLKMARRDLRLTRGLLAFGL